MNKYKQLQKERVEKLAKAKGLLGADNPSAEDIATAETLNTEVAAIDKQLAIFEANFALERSAPVASGITVVQRAEADPMRGFRSAGDFARAVASACDPKSRGIDPRLAAIVSATSEIGAAPTDFHNEGHSTDGYMVPPEMSQRIFEVMQEEESVYALTNPEPTQSNSVQLLADESTAWGSTGIQANWAAEGAALTKSRLSTSDRATKIHKLHAFVTASDELVEDAPLLSSRLTTGAARAIEWKLSEAIFRGTGAGQPLGFENSACLVTVSKEGSQAADTLLPANLTKMFSRVLAGPGARLRWLANRDVMPQLVDLKIGNEPSWVSGDRGLQNAPQGSLLGIPILFNEHNKTLGDLHDIQLVNFAGYHSIVKSGGLKFDSSIHLFFDYGVQAFRWTIRVGGQPFLSAAVAAANGTNTKSHFVTLQAR